VLPLLAIGIVEKIAFNTSYFASMLAYLFTGGPQGAEYMPATSSMDPLAHLNVLNFLSSPGSAWQ
jgi:hypothetical protein